ncbi:MAG TPA: OsmC family protein [Sphingomonadaceae bacterium]|nr:OsmC family protein [Sphingomonadaceae bacterium]
MNAITDIAKAGRVNGIDLDALTETVDAVSHDHAKGIVEFRVRTEWVGQTRSESTVESYTIGGQRIDRRFKVVADEPFELLGTNSAPNPQELLMSAVNACMMVGYVAQAAIRGINLTACRIEMSGELDLRGFLGIDPAVPNGYRELNYLVTLEGDGTRAQFEEIHAAVQATSPNFYNMNETIVMHGRLA